MTAQRIGGCDLCGHAGLDPVLDLGSSPPTCNMRTEPGPETHYPLELVRCRMCGLVMLSTRVDGAEIFPPDYPYSSGNSGALRDHFAYLADEFDPGPAALVVDVGANDGTLLRNFEARRVGVEPTNQGAGIEEVGADWYDEPLTVALAKEIRAAHGPADLVTACNVLAHVPSVNEALAAIRYLLADDGVLVAECHDLRSVVHGQWDAVYHEHLRYFSRDTFEKLLEAHDLGVDRFESIPTHGGSFRAVATHGAGPALATPWDFTEDFRRLRSDVEEQRYEVRRFCQEQGVVFGIGATARATTVINYCGLDVEDVYAIAEVAGSDKIGRLIPGTRIPVVAEDDLRNWNCDSILFSWHLADCIVPRLRNRRPRPYVREIFTFRTVTEVVG